jgi:rhodanese-related sulfurtransferase
MQQINPPQLRAWLDDSARTAPVLLDVREAWELQRAALDGAVWMPMREVPARVAELDPAADIVVVCHHGVRSFYIARFLEQQGFGRVYNLSGGVEGWARQVDPSMQTY